jgi:hypothetical protein
MAPRQAGSSDCRDPTRMLTSQGGDEPKGPNLGSVGSPLVEERRWSMTSAYVLVAVEPGENQQDVAALRQ